MSYLSVIGYYKQNTQENHDTLKSNIMNECLFRDHFMPEHCQDCSKWQNT
uniref:Uncharacterized protein n=1 Tax=Arion vulgaris TaxID=1028688 RepID=A0A0B7AJF0_9EUPU